MADRTRTLPMPRRALGFSFSRRAGNQRRSGVLTALDVEGQVLRIAQSTVRGGRPVITRLETVALESESGTSTVNPELLGAAIASALSDLRVRPAQIVMGVPRQLVILRTLNLPVIDDIRELASVVHVQVAKDLPFRLEEAVIDFQVRLQGAPTAPASPPTNSNNGVPVGTAASPSGTKADVLVAIIRRQTLEFYQKVADAAKVKLVGLGWLSQANVRTVEACHVLESGGSVALISLRPDDVGVDIIAQRSLAFSRGSSIGAKTQATASETGPSEPGATAEPAGHRTVGQDEGYVDAVTIEVVRSLHSYGGTESNSPVAKVLIAGETGQEERVAEALRRRLNISCGVLDPARALEFDGGRQQYAAGAIGALGLALGSQDPGGLPFDFQNPKQPAVQRNTHRIRVLGLTAAGVAILIGLGATRTHLVNKRMEAHRDLQQQLVAAEKKLPLYRRMQQQASTIQKWQRESRNWLEHYAFLTAVLPKSEEVYITSLSVSGQGNIHLSLQARSGEILANLDRQLRAAGYDVKPLAISPGNDKHGYNFRTTVELIVPPNFKIDLSRVQPPPRPADDGSLDGKAKTGRQGGPS